MFALPPRPRQNQSSSSSSSSPSPSSSSTTPNPPTQTITPHILPCAIQHDGAVALSRRYWDPRDDGDEDENENADGKENTSSSSTSYFRGRKLRGTRVGVPQGYYGSYTPTFLLGYVYFLSDMI